MATAIKVENLSKAYQLGEIGTGTISRDLERYWARLRGKEDPFLKIGETNDRSVKSQSNVVWSLKDLNFEIEQGDAVGIIGRNGAGKSTLLKILSRVTAPTTGSVKIKGRIASLLEVGTGFHPDLTGRENIYLNGAILGMRKAEIKRKFDEIVDFSGIERYIDTPVKRYSSGMYVRLAFAVAAHLESEILIIDEVLAVGDAEFQKKCLGKMGDVSKGEGRTILFVSHNMDAMARLCSNAMLLANSQVQGFDKTNRIIDKYLRSEYGTNALKIWTNAERPGNDIGKLIQVKATDQDGVVKETFDISENIYVTISYEVLINMLKIAPAISIFNVNGINLFDSHLIDPDGTITKTGSHKACVTIPANFLAEGTFIIGVALVTHHPFSIHAHVPDAIAFVTVDKAKKNPTRGDYQGNMPGLLRPLLKWTSLDL